VKKGDIKVVPRWVGMSMAFLAEWSVWIVSGGKKEPGLTRYGVRYSCFTRTISCEKAKRRLGYRPAISMQVGIERSVKWFLVSKKRFTEDMRDVDVSSLFYKRPFGISKFAVFEEN